MSDEEYLADIRGAAGFDGATFNAKAVRFLLRMLDERELEIGTIVAMAQNEGCDSAGNLDAIKRYLIERGRM